MRQNLAHLLAVLLLPPFAACDADDTNTNVLDRQWVAMGPTGKLSITSYQNDKDIT